MKTTSRSSYLTTADWYDEYMSVKSVSSQRSDREKRKGEFAQVTNSDEGTNLSHPG